jgi:hypothetical protein
MGQQSSAYEQLRDIINVYTKNNITPKNVSDINPRTMDDFIASEFVQALTKNIQKINTDDFISPDTKHFFNKCLSRHHELYAKALTYDSSEGTITDNYITIDDRHIKISEKNWQKFFNTIIRSYDTYDDNINRQHVYTFKYTIKNLINLLSTPAAMTFCQKKDETTTDYVNRNKKYSADQIYAYYGQYLTYECQDPIISRLHAPEMARNADICSEIDNVIYRSRIYSGKIISQQNKRFNKSFY